MGTGSSNGIKVEFDGPVMRLRLQRAPFNLLNEETLQAINAAFVTASEPGRRVHAIVLESGVPGVFSLGLDPEEILSRPAERRHVYFQLLGEICTHCLEAAVPVAVVIDGPAFAGGAVLASLGDVRVMNGVTGKLCFSESKVNLPVPRFIQELGARHCHPRYLADLFLFARSFSAQEARESGFAQELYASAEQAEEWIKAFVGRTLRLETRVLQRTLLERNHDLLAHARGFLQNLSELSPFLGDDFLGKGLMKALDGLQKPDRKP